MRVLLAPGPMFPEPGGVPLVAPELGLGADAVAQAIAAGWAQARPADALTLLPLPDGGPGTAQCVTGERIASRRVLHAPGPLGQVRETDLVRLATPEPVDGHRRNGATWLLDAARLLALPADRELAAREAQSGTTTGLGQVLAAALRLTERGDTLVVTLAATAVHDGGAGALEGLGGVMRARALMAGRELVLALADDTPLGGVGGAGQALSEVSAMSGQSAQELNLSACAAAARIAEQAGSLRGGLLPVAGGGGTDLSVTARGTGAGGGAALVLRALGARALPGARVMSRLLGLEEAVAGQDLVVTAAGELFDVLADSVVAVVGGAAGDLALPTVLVAGRLAVPRGELAEAGVVSAYPLQAPGVAQREAWNGGAPSSLRERLAAVGERLARTWSR
ncbi:MULTISPECIES: glycerate kinase [unclassified Actinomyces]|uniref:glycerate kinase n=1 Tax=unclassified Actinomyces TaxID=2609248 RepID=UPI0013741E45|nr:MULTISPECIES: glycerate kinase [unclassified Actinomyces]MBW3068135.1 glycerate kinase [Actinomyces sp. 594]NDR54572.1 glycerate kinase [Actinomyces sp. 565]QHO91068.1 glycerate kinase [Actinomyces sp. 432]